jgi:RNA polymerase sigma-70 factor (ECF subfamily)
MKTGTNAGATEGFAKEHPHVTNNPVRLRLDWFKTVILPHEAALRGRMRRVLRHREDLDDVVAEVLARAYATGDFGRITSGRAYLFQIARNLLIDEARRAKIVVLEDIVDLDLVADTLSAERLLQARDQLRRLEAIVETLPPQCRRAFILRRVHDRPVKEIAEEMGLSVFTVDKHIAKATLKVMQALGQFEDARFDDPDHVWPAPSGPTTPAQQREAIEQEAARLFHQARDSGSDEAWAQVYRWVEQSPAHGVAFAKAEAGWEMAEALRSGSVQHGVAAEEPPPICGTGPIARNHPPAQGIASHAAASRRWRRAAGLRRRHRWASGVCWAGSATSPKWAKRG